MQAGDIEDKAASPNFLVRNWPPAFKEWSIRSVRDVFFASPKFPRLLNPESIKDTIARGVENGMLGFVGKQADGNYSPFHWHSSLLPQDVEISDDVFLIQREVAEAYKTGKVVVPTAPAGGTAVASSTVTLPSSSGAGPLLSNTPSMPESKPDSSESISRLVWSGDVPHQKWMNFYTKVLSRFSTTTGLRLTLRIEVAPKEGVSSQKVEEMKLALRELGLKDSLDSD